LSKSKKVNLIANIIYTIVVAIFFTITIFELIYFYSINNLHFILHTTLISICLIIYIASKLIFNTKNFHKFFSLTIFCYFCVFLVLTIMKRYHLLDVFSSVQKLKELILSTGSAGILTFIAIQVAQVIISPIPGIATVIVGAQIYGSLWGFVYSSAGIIIGSIIAFFIGRLFGKSLAIWLVGEDNTKKWRKTLEKKGKFLLPLAFLLPFFPDDIICIIAGMTTMSFTYFLVVTLITRPIGILLGSYVFSGELIPFTWPYILIWIAILAVVAILFVIIMKNQDKIEKWFIKKFSKSKS